MPNGRNTTPGLPVDATQVGQAVELSHQTQLLHAVLAELRTEILEVGVHDGDQRQMVLEQFPVAGAKRVLAYRTGNGADGLAVPQTPAGIPVCGANEGRLGGAIVNAGANPVILYLASSAPRPGAPAVWLGVSGGGWDFRLGNLLWCGHVSAVALGGTSTITVAEV